jgi:hypothetical protein
MRPASLKPARILFASRAHGTRHRYLAGCRCLPCRAANSRYSVYRDRMKRLGLGDPLVDATPARKYLRHLSKQGIGRRAVRRATGLSENVLQKIKTGRRLQIRALTEKKILELGANCPGKAQIVPAAGAWRMINQLLREGFTKAELARRLGFATPAIQFNRRRITRRSIERVTEFYRGIMAGAV